MFEVGRKYKNKIGAEHLILDILDDYMIVYFSFNYPGNKISVFTLSGDFVCFYHIFLKYDIEAQTNMIKTAYDSGISLVDDSEQNP